MTNLSVIVDFITVFNLSCTIKADQPIYEVLQIKI